MHILNRILILYGMLCIAKLKVSRYEYGRLLYIHRYKGKTIMLVGIRIISTFLTIFLLLEAYP
jgi:hypothetical protein